LVMELVEGPNLERLIDTRMFDMPRALKVLGQVSSGLTAMHAAGVAHLDLKPRTWSCEAGRMPSSSTSVAGRTIRPGCGSARTHRRRCGATQGDGGSATAADVRLRLPHVRDVDGAALVRRRQRSEHDLATWRTMVATQARCSHRTRGSPPRRADVHSVAAGPQARMPMAELDRVPASPSTSKACRGRSPSAELDGAPSVAKHLRVTVRTRPSTVPDWTESTQWTESRTSQSAEGGVKL
jgi:hypothetical protein